MGKTLGSSGYVVVAGGQKMGRSSLGSGGHRVEQNRGGEVCVCLGLEKVNF